MKRQGKGRGTGFVRVVCALALLAACSMVQPSASAALLTLGEADAFALLAIGNGSDAPSIRISSASSVIGTVGVGPDGSYQLSASSAVIGTALLAAGVSQSISASSDGGTIIQPSDLSQAIMDALEASSTFAILSATQSFGDITDSLTITGNGGLNVISAHSIDLSGLNVLTLSGGAGDVFVFNIADVIDLTGSSQIALNGISASQVLFNFPAAGGALSWSGSSLPVGIVLAPQRDFTLHGADFTGSIVANDIWISSGGTVRHEVFAGVKIPEPAGLALFGLGFAGIAFRRARSSA